MRNWKNSFLMLISLIFGLSTILSSCKKDDDLKSNQAQMLSFVFNDLSPAVSATINGTNITATVPFGTDLTNLKPTIEVSPKAVVSPGSGIPNNFTSGATYIVTAEDLTTKVTYNVTVNTTEPDDPTITGFTLGDADIVVNHDVKTITIKLLEGTDVTALAPTITIAPEGAVINPASGTEQDFTNPVQYTVTVGDKEAVYTATVEFIPIGFTSYNIVLRYLADAGNLPFITGDHQRGMAMNADYIFVADKSVNEIHYFDRKGISTEVFKLNKGTQGVIAGGTFLIADVVTNGNMIFASNLAIGSVATPANLRIYKWENKDDAEPELFFTYPTTVRLGDNFTVSGDLATEGNLWFISNTTGDNKIYRFDVVGGVVTNPSAPVITTLNFTGTLPYERTGNYGSVFPIGSGDNIKYLVNGADMVPALFDKDGNKLTNILSNAISVRTVGAVLFDFNQATYLAYTLTSDANPAAMSKLVLVNVTGANLVDVMNSITLDNVDNFIELAEDIDDIRNGNVAGDVAVYIDQANGKVFVAGFACNNGIVEVELVK